MAPTLREAVIVDGVRTPFGRYGGALREVRPDDLAALVLRTLVERNRFGPDLIEDVILGCANQAGEDNRNVARMAALLAGLPMTVPGQTVNRLCGSGLQAIVSAHQAIHAGEGDLFLAGGVESMTRAPLVMLKPDRAFNRGEQTLFDTTIGWRFTNPALAVLHHPYSMGETAENVAKRHGVSRQDQDAFAAESQRRAGVAAANGWLESEIVPVSVVGADGQTVVVTVDESPWPDTTPERLATLKAAFQSGGAVTAGNASGINDGAAALLIADRTFASAHDLPIRGRVVTSAVSGVDPAVMGIGPVTASRKAMDRAGLAVSDLDAIELNEAFAAQSVACIRELGFDPARVNPNGGAIALGHPLGASGSRLMISLLHHLERTGGRYGLATMCIGVGQGIAVVIERL